MYTPHSPSTSATTNARYRSTITCNFRKMNYNEYIQAKNDTNSSVSKLIVSTRSLINEKKQQLKLLVDYLNIGLTTLSSNSNFQIYEIDVKNYLQHIFSNEQQEFIDNAYSIILSLCTHRWNLFNSVTYTESASDFIKECLIDNKPDTQNLKTIKQFLDNNFSLPLNHSVQNDQLQLINKLMQIVIHCGKNNTNHWKFKGMCLEGINFDNLNLSGVDFSNAQLRNCSFKNATLNSTIWGNAQLENIDFSQSNLDNVDFTTATIKQLNIDDVASLINTRFNVNSIVNWRIIFSTRNFKPQHQHLVIQILTNCKNNLEGLELTEFSLPLSKPPTVKTISNNQHNININDISDEDNLVKQFGFQPLNHLTSEELPAILIIQHGCKCKYIWVSGKDIAISLTLSHSYNRLNQHSNLYILVTNNVKQKGIMRVFRNIPVEMLPTWLQNVNFNGVKLDQQSFNSLMRINIAGAVVHNVNLEDLDLRDANLVGLQIKQNASFKKSFINLSQLEYLYKSGFNLAGVVLSTIDFTNLDLRDIDLSNTELFSYEDGLLPQMLTDAVKFDKTKLNKNTYEYIIEYVSATHERFGGECFDLGEILQNNIISFDLSDLPPNELQQLMNGKRDNSCLCSVPIIISQEQLIWLSEHGQTEIKYIIIKNADLSNVDLQRITFTNCVMDNVIIEGTASQPKIVNINYSRFINRVTLDFVDLRGNPDKNIGNFINLFEASIKNTTITTDHLNFFGSVNINNSFLNASNLSIRLGTNSPVSPDSCSVYMENIKIKNFNPKLLHGCKFSIENFTIENWKFIDIIIDQSLDKYFNHLNNPTQGSMLTYINSVNNVDFKVAFMEKLVDWIENTLNQEQLDIILLSLADILLLPTYYKSTVIQAFIADKLQSFYEAGNSQIIPISERLIHYLDDTKFSVQDNNNPTMELARQHEFMISYNGFFLQCIYFCRQSSDEAIYKIGVTLYAKYLNIEYINKVITQSEDNRTDTSLNNTVGYDEWENDHLIFIRINHQSTSNHLLCITNEFMATHLHQSKNFGTTLIVNPPAWGHFLYYNNLQLIKPSISNDKLFVVTDLFIATYKEFMRGNTPQKFEEWIKTLNLNEEYTQLFLNPIQRDLTGLEANQQFTWAFYGYKIVKFPNDSNTVPFTPNIIYYKILNETTSDLIYYTNINNMVEKHQLQLMLKGDKIEVINTELNTTLTLDNRLNIAKLDGDLITNILESMDIKTCGLIKLDLILFNENRIIFNPDINNPNNRSIKDQVELTDSYINKITLMYNLDLWQQDNEYVAKIWMHSALMLIRYSSSHVFGKSLNSPALIRLLIAAYLKLAHKIAPKIITQDNLTNWLDRLFAQNNQFDCTAMLFDRVHIDCKSKFGDDFSNLLPPFCRS